MGAVCTNCRDPKVEEKDHEIDCHTQRDSYSQVRAKHTGKASDVSNGEILYVKTVDYSEIKPIQGKMY
jgi:hypothetical protein